MTQFSFRAVHHIAWTVAEIDPVADFYQRVFGARLLFRLGPIDAKEMPRNAQGQDWSETHLNLVDARFNFALLTFPCGFRLELFEYERPRGQTSEPLGGQNVGAHHLGIEVENIETSSIPLKVAGCRLFDIIAMEEGPMKGFRFRYFTDPWSNMLELVQLPPSVQEPIP